MILEIKSYDNGSKEELEAVKDILFLSKNAKDIFISSKLDEKQQLLGFFFSNLTLNHEKLDVDLRGPFKNIAIMQNQTLWRRTCGTLRTFRWSKLKEQASRFLSIAP